MVVKALEAIQTSTPKRTLFTRAMIAAFVLLIATVAHRLIVAVPYRGVGFFKGQIDFENFYLVAQRVWLGDLDQVYRYTTFEPMQREAWGSPHTFFAWAYPPQFDLVIAPAALIPAWSAYLVFMTTTLVLFLIGLRALAKRHFVLVLLLVFPIVEFTILSGQNGFLTAGLIGLICLFLEERPIVAGLALGALVIKPHLAIAFAVYVILRRSWTAILAAGIVVLASSALCTIVFGAQIWAGLLQGMRENLIMLNDGTFPLYRMISVYASLRSLGLSASLAFMGQAAVTAMALGVISMALYRKVSSRISLGLTAMLSLCMSPYVWDYDFPIFGIGLALLLPVLHGAKSVRERGAIYITTMLIGAFSILRAFILGTLDIEVGPAATLSLGGLMLVGVIGFMLIIIARPKTHAPCAEFGSLSRETEPLPIDALVPPG